MPVNFNRLKELAKPKIDHGALIKESKRKTVSLKKLETSIERLSKPKNQRNLKDMQNTIKMTGLIVIESPPKTTETLIKNAVDRNSRCEEWNKIPSSQMKNKTSKNIIRTLISEKVPVTSAVLDEHTTPWDEGGDGKRANSGGQCTAEGGGGGGGVKEDKDDDDDDDDDDDHQCAAVNSLATKDECDRRTSAKPRCAADEDGAVLGDGDATVESKTSRPFTGGEPGSTVSFVDFLEENAQQLLLVHAECSHAEDHGGWPKEESDPAKDSDCQPPVAVDDGVVQPQGRASASRPRDSLIARGCGLIARDCGLTAYLHGSRQKVVSAYRFGVAKLNSFFRQLGERIGYILGFEFLTSSTVCADTRVEC